MNIRLGVPQAAYLAEKARSIERAAGELLSFVDQEPALAGDCGVEVNAVEARSLLMGGCVKRVVLGAAKDGAVTDADLSQLSRLEGVLALASSRIGAKIAALEAAEGQALTAKLGSIIGLATGAVGLVKTIL